MNRAETATCYTLACKAYGAPIDELELRSWHELLHDLDGSMALEATRRLCLRDAKFKPNPGEIKTEVERIDGATPPPMNAAIGFYLAGEWDEHPLIRTAAEKVYWDRNNEPEKARHDFRNHYAAALDQHENGHTPRRPAIGESTPQPLALGAVMDELAGSERPSPPVTESLANMRKALRDPLGARTPTEVRTHLNAIRDGENLADLMDDATEVAPRG